MRKRLNMRLANGVASAAIVCFFLLHGLLGSFAFALPSAHPFLWVVWIGVGFVAGLVASFPLLPKLATVVLSIVLAWHICVGMKSLLKDIGLSKRLMTPLRIVVCALAAVFCFMTLIYPML